MKSLCTGQFSTLSVKVITGNIVSTVIQTIGEYGKVYQVKVFQALSKKLNQVTVISQLSQDSTT